jgi:hypothetical protein
MWSSRKSSRRFPLRPGIALGFLLLVSLTCCGAEPTETDSTKGAAAEEHAAKTLLPAEAGGLSREGEADVYPGEGLFEHINGGADIYHEYGFVTLIVQRYTDQDKSASVEIYHMGDPPGAFGIYSYNRHPTLSPADLGGDGVIHDSGAYFWRDRYYVDIGKVGGADVSADEFLALAKAIDENIVASASEPASEPETMKLLPSENMVERSAVFAKGRLGINNQVYVASENLFGLEQGEAAVIAQYRLGQHKFFALVAEYESAAACDDAFKRLRAHFLGEESVREEEFAVAPKPGKHHAVREAGTRLLFVANADSEENALAMLDRISAHIDDSVEAE